VALIPIRSFHDAKSRLAEVLSPDQRRAMAIAMAATVVNAAHDLPVWVVTDDPEVVEWARSVGAEPIAVDRRGLTESITAATDLAAARGFARVVIAHADLPLAVDLRVVTGPGIAIAPDRRCDGSNVMSVPTAAGFRFAYGPGSFHAHKAEAERLSLAVDVIDSPDLAWDVDDPEDLPADWPDLISHQSRSTPLEADRSAS